MGNGGDMPANTARDFCLEPTAADYALTANDARFPVEWKARLLTIRPDCIASMKGPYDDAIESDAVSRLNSTKSPESRGTRTIQRGNK
jgi:hypothetical protein